MSGIKSLSNLKSLGNKTNPNNREIFDKYLKEIKIYKPLSKLEEIELFKRLEINCDDVEARDKLCKHNLLFVLSVANAFQSRIATGQNSLTLEDLVNEGNIGLLIAISKFDYTRGNKFISYAVWHIRATIQQSLYNNIKSIRIPTNAIDILTAYNKINTQLEQTLERLPDISEIFDELNKKENFPLYLKSENLGELINVSTYESRLNSLVSLNGSTTELVDVVESDSLNPFDILLNKEHKELIINLLDDLPNKTKLYIYHYFGLLGYEQLNVREIGLKFDVPSANITLIIKRNLRKIRINNRTNSDFKINANVSVKLKKSIEPIKYEIFDDEMIVRKNWKETEENTTYLI